MINGYKVIWSQEAYKNLEAIINYFEARWTQHELRKFVVKLEKRIILITQRPQIFPLTHSRGNIRRSVLSKQTTIYYKVRQMSIEIVSLFDTRQDPDKLRL